MAANVKFQDLAPSWVAGLMLLCLSSNIFAVEEEQVVRARLETCGGWRLNRLPQVKAFINDDADKYPHLEVRYIGGIDPRMLFLDENEEETERVALAEKTRDEINEMMTKRGFTQEVEEDVQETEDEEMPKEKLEF